MTPLENKGYGRIAVMSLIALFFCGVAILWSWNTLAVDLFGQPALEFRHAVAAEFLLIAAGSLFGLSRVIAKFRAG